MKCLGIPWHAGNAWNFRRNMPFSANDWKFRAFHVMPGRGRANIVIWPKSSEYRLSRHYMECQRDDTHFLWRFRGSWMFAFSCCYDFFPFSEEKRQKKETAPSLFVDTSLTNGTGLRTKIQPYGTCTSSANAVRPHEMRVQNGATISPGVLQHRTIYRLISLTNGSSLCTPPQPYGTCTFE